MPSLCRAKMGWSLIHRTSYSTFQGRPVLLRNLCGAPNIVILFVLSTSCLQVPLSLLTFELA